MTKPSGKARSRSILGLLAGASIVALSALTATPAQALVVRDDVGVDASVDVDNEWAGVGQMWNRILNPAGTAYAGTYLCTGTMINPRTIVFAQHCTGGMLDEQFDPGAGAHMGFGFDPVGGNFAAFDAWRRGGNPANGIANPFTGNWASLPDQSFYNVLQVRSVFNTEQPFPGGDLSIASFDTPAIGLPTYGMLFSPLSGPTHAALAAYGTNGTGSLGDVGGIDDKRRVGENMIDGLFSQNDFIAGVFNVPGAEFTDPPDFITPSVEAAQLLYHIDFDRPDRNANDCARGEFFGLGFGNDIVCNTGPYGSQQPLTWDFTSAILTGDHIDWYPGNALANEAGTAGGDSGSALFADQIYSRPLITGVLSGGWVAGFFGVNGGYGDVSYYNPLFLFRDWLVENNPYVYASANNGNRNWSDPRHWTQAMDPNYFYIDRFGRVRNGLPSGAQPGYYADDPKWGTVFDLSVPDQVEGGTAGTGPTSTSTLTTQNALGVYNSPEHGGHGGGNSGGSSSSGNTASVGGPTGPGSTRFVPNNDYGTYGDWESSADGVARFYDVTLANVGRTRLDMNVEIDNLSVTGYLSELDVRSGYRLNSLVAVDQHRGFVNVDGQVHTREYMVWGGVLTGRGSITAETVYNVDGVISAGDLTSIGRLTINGDYVQASAGDMVVNVRRNRNALTSDFVQVNGAIGLDGDAFVVPVDLSSLPRYQDVYTVMNATGGVSGEFDDIHLVTIGPSLYGDTVVRSNGNVDIVVKARSLGGWFGNHRLRSLGDAIDRLRWGGHYNNFQGMFDLIDTTDFANFERTLFGITPANSFETVPLAIQYSQGFTQGLDARTAELRAGVRGLSPRSVLAGMRIAQAGVTDDQAEQGQGFTTSRGRTDENDRVGFFVAGQGNLSAVGNEAYEGDRYNPASISAFSTADMTVGMDYRVNDNFALGIATTLSRYLSRNAERGVTPMDHTGYGVMAYATAWDGAWHLDSYVGVARHDYAMARIPGADFGNEIDANAGAVQSMAGVRAGYSFSPAEGLTIGPAVALNYSSLSMDGYREMGGGEFALEVEGRTLNSITVESAVEFAYQPMRNGAPAPLAAYGRLGIVNELGDGVDLVTARFMMAPDIGFDIGREMDRQWMSASTGLSYRFSDSMSANFEASSDMGRGDLSNTSIQAGFNWRF